MLWLEPRATAAVLIDSEGETVDYASSLPSYYTKVAAAYLRVVIDDIVDARHLLQGDARPTPSSRPLPQLLRAPAPRRLRARSRACDAASFPCLRTSRRAHPLPRSPKKPAGAAPSEETLPWHPVEVESDPRIASALCR